MASKLFTVRNSRGVQSAYERFIANEGVPVLGGFGVHALREITMAAWPRIGCEGAYLQFFGSDGVVGVYAGRIAPGGATLPERHLYEKIFYFLEGEGVAEIQQRDRVPQSIRWQAGTLFSPPMNTLHRIMNYSDRPALFLALTTAPVALDHYRSERFVFHSDFVFDDRYDGQENYSTGGFGRINSDQRQCRLVGEVHDNGSADSVGKPRRIKITRFEIANNSLVAQHVEWPAGRYRRAHCRSGGVALLILRSSGYSLMWPSRFGTQPYKNGLADHVVRVDWRPGSVFSPPANWFHQHFNTGKEAAQTLAFYCGSTKFPMSRQALGSGIVDTATARQPSTLFGDDDPSIRSMYEAELAKQASQP
jgi:oxalate decarboxylase/phosphoglucose isomerase-like protein (cupin superfamily)